MRCWEIKRSFVKLVAFSFQIKAQAVASVLVGDGLGPSLSSCSSLLVWGNLEMGWMDGWIPVTDGYVSAPLTGGTMPEAALRQVCIQVLALDCSNSCPGCCSWGGTSHSNPEAVPTSCLGLRWPDVWSSMTWWVYKSDTRGPCTLPGPMSSGDHLSSRMRRPPVSYFI